MIRFESVAKREMALNTIIASLFMMPFVLFIMIKPSDWAGIFIIAGTMFSILVNKEFLQNKKVFSCGIVVLLLHHSIAFMNAYCFPTLGTGADDLLFQQNASMVAELGNVNLLVNGSAFYVNFLALFYKVFGTSHLLGMELSVLAFFLSMIVLLKILRITNQTKYEHIIIVMYGALPSVFLFSSITLRESWQMLFFLLIIYSTLMLRRSHKIRWFILLLLSIVSLAFWHNGFLALLPIVMFVSLYWALKSRKKMSFVLNFFVFCIALGIIFVSFKLVGGYLESGASSAFTSGKTFEYIEGYRSSGKLYAEASYASSVNLSGAKGVLLGIPVMFIGYMFTPYPWMIRGTMDIYAFAESCLRFFLILCAFRTWRKSEGEERNVFGFLFVIFFMMELLWSMGTINWGTAMRHHIVAYGILLALGGNRFIHFIKNTRIVVK